jgi:hypothetical protein
MVTVLLLAGPVNSRADGLTITDRPLDLVSSGDTVAISWSEPLRASLLYAARPGGGDPAHYPFSISDLITDLPGRMAFLPGDQLSPGVHYCLLSSGSGASDEFLLLVESPSAPVTISPRTPQGSAGIETVEPVFRWHAVPGVPYYHLLLSDQPFRIRENEEGELGVTGANIIWQAITAGTSLPYGTPDPSGTLPPAHIPPLVSGLRYNWLVLNNYGNHPALSSVVTAGPSGFAVDVQPPFPPPQLIAPAPSAVLTESPIVFRWSQVPGANGYHLDLFEILEEDGSSVALPVFGTFTSRTEYHLSVSGHLRSGDHTWKVLAADDAGYGALSQENRFTYLTESSTLIVKTYHDGGTPDDHEDDVPLPRTEVTVERLSGQGDPWDLLTDENGYLDVQLPLGSYRLNGSLSGYQPCIDTVRLNQDGQTIPSTLTLSAISSVVFGSTVDAQGDPLPWVQVNASAADGEAICSVESDLNGSFRLLLEPGTWIVSADKTGYISPDGRLLTISAGQQINLDEPAAGGPLVLVPCRYLLSGQVTNPDGGTIWQAEVVVSNGTLQFTDQTDALGQYEFSIEPGTWTVSASKPGYAQPEAATATVTDADATANLVLVPRASLVSGWITDGQNGLPQATVTATPLAGAPASVPTGPSGDFTLSLLPGTYQLVAGAANHVPSDPITVTLGWGESHHQVELLMIPAEASLRGRTTSNGLSGLSGVLITNGVVSTVSSPDGCYRLPVSAGSHRLQATKLGRIPAHSGALSLSKGQHLSGIDLVLPGHAGTVEGRVMCHGRPVVGAQVVIGRPDGATMKTKTDPITSDHVQTDQAGRFVHSLSPGDYLLFVIKPGLIGQPQGRPVNVRAGQWTILEPFYLEEHLARIGGRTFSRSQPLDGVQVQLKALWPDGPDYLTVTDQDGRFALQVSAGGRYALTASRSGYLSAGDTIQVSSPGVFSQVALKLEPCESRIEGQVTDTEDAPLSDVLVSAGDSTSVYEVRSGRYGRFELPVRAGRYRLWITRPGYAGRTAEVTVPLGSVVSGQNFILQPNFVTIIGEVLDAFSDAPLAGVLVTATSGDSSRGGSSRTDAAGQFIIPDLTPGVYRIAASPAGYQPQELTQRILVGGQFARADFSLNPYTAVIHGRVSSGETPLSGATVTAESHGFAVSRTTTSDAAGRFELSRLPSGVLIASAFKSGYSGPAPDTVLLAAGETDSIHIELSPNLGLVAGRAVSATDGIGDVRVTARGQDGHFAADSTAPDGRFRLHRLASDSYTITLDAEGYLTAPAETSVVVNGSDSLFLPFELSHCGLSASGQVIDAQGEFLPGVTVRASSGQQIHETVTDSSGNYRLDGLSPGMVYTLSTVLYQEGYVNDTKSLEIGIQDVTGINLVVQVTQGIIAGSAEVEGVSVTVTGAANGINRTVLSQPDGSYQVDYLPAGDYLVGAHKVGWTVSPDAQQVSGLGAREHRMAVDFTSSADTTAIQGQVVDQDLDPVPGAPVTAVCPRLVRCDTTDAQGWYHIDRLYPQQTYQVGTVLDDRDYDNARLMVEVDDDPITAPQLQVVVHGAVITGQITDHQGQPRADAVVRLSPGTAVVISDHQGWYRFSGLHSGIYEMEASATGWSAPIQEIEAHKGDTVTVDLSLHPVQGAIYGQACQAGESLPGVLVILSSSEDGSLADTTDFSGNYAFEDLDISQSYQLVANKRGHETRVISGIALPAGQSRRLDLSLPQVPNTITGTVCHDEDGTPAPGTLVQAISLTGATRSDTCDNLGQYCLFDLPSGPCALTAMMGSLSAESRFLVMAPGRSERFDLVLAERGSIVGTVAYRDLGRPGALLAAVHRQTGEPFLAASRSSGTFSIPGLSPGDYDVTVSIRGFETAESPGCLTILPGSQRILDIDLEAVGFALLGSVRDTHDRPVAGAAVIASTDGQADSTITDLCGNYALNLSPASRCVVHTRAGGHHQAPAETVSVIRGQVAMVDFELVPRANSIMGTVVDGRTGATVGGAEAVLTDSVGTQMRDSTSVSGQFLFSVLPGHLTISVERDGYEAWGPREIELRAGGLVTLDVVLNPLVSMASLGGTVTWGDQPLGDAQVVARSVDGDLVDTVWTENDGRYLFAMLPAGQDYLLEASRSGFKTLSSGPIRLPSEGQAHDLHFPRGRIDWTISGQGGCSLAGVFVHLSSEEMDTTMITDAEGACHTEEHLGPGLYQTGLIGLGDYVPVIPYQILLQMDENRTESIPLSIRHTPFPEDSAFSVGESIPICAWVEGPEESTELFLFYRHPGADDLSVQPMTPDGKNILSLKGRFIPDADGAKDRSGMAVVAYRAVIPGGEEDGRLEYFVEAVHRGRTYSRCSSPWELDVLEKGTLHKAIFSPAEKRLPLDLPYVFRLLTYDVQGHNLNYLLTHENVSWALIKGPGEIEVDPQDPTLATFISHTEGLAVLEATVTLGGLTLRTQAQATCQSSMLGRLEIIGPALPMIASGNPAMFRYVAQDTSGLAMSIWPRWDIQPEGAGSVSRSLNGDRLTFTPHADIIGQVRVSVSDSFSGEMAEYNIGAGAAECDCGLSVYYSLVGGASGTSVGDRQGFRLLIPDAALRSGSATQISLRTPVVPDVKRYTPQYQIHGLIYEVNSSSPLFFDEPVELVLPICEKARGLTSTIGRWDDQALEWAEIGGICRSGEICASVDHFSQFAVLNLSEPLGWSDIRLLPNPFTPHDPHGLQLSFTLSSDRARQPFVTIRVYNLTGQLVRTICQNEPVPKGTYLPGESFLDSRGQDITVWDGRTDAGELARNGRYLIYFRAGDSSGTVEKLLPVVLIK